MVFYKFMNNKKVRILYHVAASEIGGSVFSFYELLKNIDKERYKPLILITKNECQQFVDDINKLGIDIIYENIRINTWIKDISNSNINFKFIIKFKAIGRFIRHFSNAYKIARIIKNNKIDIVHTNDENLIDAALGAFFSGSKHVWHIRARIGKDGLLTHFLGTVFVLKVINLLSDRIIVNSKSTFKPWEKERITKNILLIYNGVNVEKFKNGIGSLRQEYGLPNDSRVVAMISTIPFFDGLNYFIDAAGIASAQNSNVYFFMIGKTNTCSVEYLKIQEEKINNLGLRDRFFFTGFRTDIPNILADINILIEPMQNGAWSRVILESMAAGVPVIGVEEDKISDFIENDETGVLVSKQNEIGLALIELLNDKDKIKNISENSTKKVVENFSSKIYAKKIMSLYNDLQ